MNVQVAPVGHHHQAGGGLGSNSMQTGAVAASTAISETEMSKAVEHKVTDLVEEVVSVDMLESSFNLFLVHRKDVE